MLCVTRNGNPNGSSNSAFADDFREDVRVEDLWICKTKIRGNLSMSHELGFIEFYAFLHHLLALHLLRLAS